MGYESLVRRTASLQASPYAGGRSIPIILVVKVERRCQAGVVADAFGVVRPIEPLAGILRAKAGFVQIAVVRDDHARLVDDQYSVIELIADDRLAVAGANRAGWQGRRIAVRIGGGQVLPNRVIVGVGLH